MEKRIKQLKDHYIVCGFGRVGRKICRELKNSNNKYVAIDSDEVIKKHQEDEGLQYFIEGDATGDTILEKAGIKNAIGLFATTGDDNQNIVITLSAKLIKPSIRVITRCEESLNLNKMKRSGADSVISPAHMGGIRMTTEMIKPHLNSLVDYIFQYNDNQHIIESFTVGDSFAGKQLNNIDLQNLPDTILLAVQKSNCADIVFNPHRDIYMQKDDILIVITSQTEKDQIEKVLQS